MSRQISAQFATYRGTPFISHPLTNSNAAPPWHTPFIAAVCALFFPRFVPITPWNISPSSQSTVRHKLLSRCRCLARLYTTSANFSFRSGRTGNLLPDRQRLLAGPVGRYVWGLRSLLTEGSQSWNARVQVHRTDFFRASSFPRLTLSLINSSTERYRKWVSSLAGLPEFPVCGIFSFSLVRSYGSRVFIFCDCVCFI